MKIVVRYLLIGCMCFARVHAQPSVVTYVSKVALVVQSGVYVDTLVNDTLMHVLSARIRIALAPPKLATESDQYLIAGNAVGKVQMDGLLYRIHLNTMGEKWYPAPPQTQVQRSFPYGRLLVDTVLRPGDRLMLEFRSRHADAIIQRCVFAREDLIPGIQQYRENKHGSRTDDSIRARILQRNKKLLKAFVTPLSNTITLDAGRQLEMLLRYHALSKDSTVQYRLVSAGKRPGEWTKSGHLLTLNDLPSNDSVLLELRYEGMSRSKVYKLVIRPYWHQRIWAWLLFVATGISLLVVLPVGLHRRRMALLNKQRQQGVTELKHAQSQLNPHFIFNALHSIDALVHAGENDKATQYLTDFSDMMRNTLRSNHIIFTTLAEDFAILEKYLRIEQLRFDFQYCIEIEEPIDPAMIEFPPMLLQPTVENAVKHGVSGMKGNGLIQIQVSAKGTDLVVTIEDNGNGKITGGKGTGYGIVFTKERIAMLEKLYGHAIHYTLSFTQDKTIAVFCFRNWL